MDPAEIRFNRQTARLYTSIIQLQIIAPSYIHPCGLLLHNSNHPMGTAISETETTHRSSRQMNSWKLVCLSYYSIEFGPSNYLCIPWDHQYPDRSHTFPESPSQSGNKEKKTCNTIILIMNYMCSKDHSRLFFPTLCLKIPTHSKWYPYLLSYAGLWIRIRNRIRIRIQSGLWIQIRIRIRNPDPDPRGQKWPTKVEKNW